MISLRLMEIWIRILRKRWEEVIGEHIGELMNVTMRVEMLCEWKQLGAVRFDGK